MQRRTYGETNLDLPVVTFGAWAIGGTFWAGTDDQQAIEALQASIDAGVDAIDTAPIYGEGHSEKLVGQAIRGRRDQVKILTKCGLRWDNTTGEHFFTLPRPGGGEMHGYKLVTADSITHECEQSLKRLGIDTIDLYQVHWPSETAPADQVMGTLNRLREQGKIREIGVSNYDTDWLRKAREFAPIVSNQIKYNLLERRIEADPLPYCRSENVGVIAYSPMAMGLLTGKVTMDRIFEESDLRSQLPWFQPKNRAKVLAALDQIRPIAESYNCTLAQLSVAWVIAQEGVWTALVGARNAQQARENAKAGEVVLKQPDIDTIRRTFEAVGEPEE